MQETIDELLMRAPATELVLVDFYAPWCAPCKALMTSLPKLEEHYAGRLSVVKVNIEEEADVATELSVRSIPHLVLVQRDAATGNIVGTKTGMQSLPQLISWIDTSSSDDF
jgi:thioredoxin